MTLSRSLPSSVLLLRGAVPCRSRQALAVPDGLDLAVARIFSRWRPLLWFWLAILAIAAAGGAVLQRLGPPHEHVARDQVQSGPQWSAGPVEPEPPTAAPASPAAAPPTRPEVAEQLARAPSAGPAEPVPSLTASAPLATSSPARPAADEQRVRLPSHAQASGGTDQESTQPRSPVLVTLHPARPEDGRALAEQLASQIGLAPGQIGMGAAGDLRSGAVIRFFSERDHALARRLGKELTQLGYAWRIENLSDRPLPPGHQVPEVWLPER